MAEEGARPTWRRRAARNRNIVVGAAILTVVILAALLAGVISTHDPRRLNPAQRLQAPSATNLLGTDEFGRDVFSLVLYGAQVSLLVGATVEEIEMAREAFRAMLKTGGPAPTGRFSDLKMLEPVMSEEPPMDVDWKGSSQLAPGLEAVTPPVS